MLEIINGRQYVSAQIKKHLGLLHDLSPEDIAQIEEVLPPVFEKVCLCWKRISNKYYHTEGLPTLDINNSNQYTQFLLILSKELSQQGYKKLADKFFGLNKMLNGCDIYHEINLPQVFYINHSVGLVVGRASFGENLFLSQNCTIGGNPGKPLYPSLGKDNYLMANVTIIGKVKSGDRVVFSAGSYVKDGVVPSDSIVFGRYPDNIIKPLGGDQFKMLSLFSQN